MRVLHCIPTLGGGGAERQLACLSQRMSEVGISVHIAYTRRGPNFDRVKNSGVIRHELVCARNYDPRILWQLVKTIQSVKPHIVHTWLTQMDVLGGLAAILTRTPFILSEQSSSKAYVGTWKDRLRLLIGKKSFAIIANSRSGKEYWQKVGGINRIEVVRNGIPRSEILRSCRISDGAENLSPSTQLILWAGRYSAEKNPMMLLKAVPEVLSKNEDAVVIFLGDGPLKRELIALVNQWGMQARVRIEAFSTDLWSWMKRARLFISTSIYEGSPNAVFEAAAARCPLLLSDIPQHRELLNDESAVFVPLNDPTALAQCIISALSDPGRLERNADVAYRELSEWTLESVTDDYLSIYGKAARFSYPRLTETVSGCLGRD